LLKLRQCKTAVILVLKECDAVEKIHFCNWFPWSIYYGEVDSQLVLLYNKAWYSLPGELNSQNSWYWSAENPRISRKLPLLDERN
jgi:hypothetical protein